jgi:hypothetical protein
MKIFEVIAEDKKTWMKDGVEMCSKDCCGQPVTECECGPECKHCDCYKLNERYGMSNIGGAGQRQAAADYINVNKRINNKAADANREINIANKSTNRRINRLQRKQATGMPQRILNPQQAQTPEQQS